MSILERIRMKAANAEAVTMQDYCDLVEHIQQIEDGYRRLIALAGGFHCRVGAIRRWRDAA